MKDQREWIVDDAINALRESDASSYRLSKITGLSAVIINSYRLGRSKPKLETARIICDALERYRVEQERKALLPEPVGSSAVPAKDSMLNTALETIKLQMQENARLHDELKTLTMQAIEALNYYHEMITHS